MRVDVPTLTTMRIGSALPQLAGLFVGGDDGVHGRAAEAALLQHAHPLDGGAAGAADGVLQSAGVAAVFQQHPGRAQHHLGGVLLGLGPGQAAGHAAVGQGLDELPGPGRAAARHAAGRVDQVFGDGIHPAGADQQAAGAGFLVPGEAQGAVGHHPFAHCGGDIGVDADDGIIPAGHLPDLRHGQPRRHGAQDEPFAPGCPGGKKALQGSQHPGHHLGLDPQKDQIAAGGVLVRAGAAAQFGGQRFGLGGGAVCQHHILRRGHPADGPGQRPAHIAAANKAHCFHSQFLLIKV